MATDAGAGRAAGGAAGDLEELLPSSRAPHAHAELHHRQAACAEEIALELAAAGAPAAGEDTRGTRFASVPALWRTKANPRAARSWYQLGADYWAGIPQDLDGVLGGDSRPWRAAAFRLRFPAPRVLPSAAQHRHADVPLPPPRARRFPSAGIPSAPTS